MEPDIAPAIEPVPTEEELRRKAARERAEKWRRTFTSDRARIVATLRRKGENDERSAFNADANLAADILEDIADGRLP